MKWKCLDDFIALSSVNDNENVDDIDRIILFHFQFNKIEQKKKIKYFDDYFLLLSV